MHGDVISRLIADMGRRMESDWSAPLMVVIERLEPRPLEGSISQPIQRLRRLRLARHHLNRASEAELQIDVQANWNLSVVYYCAATEGTTIDQLIWTAVRHDISHILTEPADAGWELEGGRQPEGVPEHWLSPPLTHKGAAPMIRFDQIPPRSLMALLNGLIRDAAVHISLMMIGSSRSTYLAWERVMNQFSVNVMFEWDLADVERLRGWDVDDGQITRATHLINWWPGGEWSGMLELYAKSSDEIRGWLVDEVLAFAMFQCHLVDRRLERVPKRRTPMCDEHCSKMGWTYGTPICELRGMTQDECLEYVETFPRAAERMLESMEIFHQRPGNRSGR